MKNKSCIKIRENLVVALLSIFAFSAVLANQHTIPGAERKAGQKRALVAGKSYIREGDLNAALKFFAGMVEDPAIDTEALYFLGVVFNEMGKPQVAREYIMSAVSLSGDRLAWRESLAKVYESLGEFNLAIGEYRAILESGDADKMLRSRASKKARYLEASQYARQRNIAQALSLFRELAEEYPDDTLILYSLGVANMLTNHLEEAARMFEQVLDLDPDYSNAYLGFLNLASVYEKKGNIARAAEILQMITGSEASDEVVQQAEIRLNLIEVKLLVNDGNLGEALALVNSILEIDPDNIAALMIAADIYLKTGDLEEEARVRDKIRRINPGNVDNLIRQAVVYAETSRVREAIVLLEQAIEKGANTAYEQQARTLLQQIYATDIGQLIAEEMEQDRIAQYEMRVKRDPDDFDAHVELVTIYLQRGDIEKARTELEHVVRLDPQYKQGRITLASVYDELGRFADAVDQYAAAVALEVDFERARQLANALILVNAKNLYVEGKLDLSVSEFEEILSREPDNAMAHFYVGLIYSTRQEVMKAANEYKAVLQLAPAHISARLNLAMSFEMMNREEDAIGEYQKILQANPSENIATTARARLRNAERRINGLMANMGYLMSYNSNTNLSDDNAEEDYVSNLNLSLAYQYKMENGLRWRFLTTPSYEIFHEGQFDFLNTSTTLSATYIPGEITYVAGYTYRTNMGLITGDGFSRSNAFFAEGFTRKKLPSIIAPFSARRVLTGLSGNASYTNLNADDSPFFSAYVSTAGVSLNQPLGQRQALNLGYTYIKNSNKEFVGSDYAYTSHGFNVGVEQGFPYGISGNMNYRFTQFNYKNPDSFSQFSKRRRNRQHSIQASASRRLKNNINLFVSLAWTLNKSNLPVGFILDPEEIVLGQQSTSLSDYDRLIFSTGLNVNF